jgi:hypothetical protein
MTYQLRRKKGFGIDAAVTLQMTEVRKERRSNTPHVKANCKLNEGNSLDVAQRRNVKGRGSSRGGQGADDKQVVEWKGSCKWSSANTGVGSVSIVYSGVPGQGSAAQDGE